MLIGVWRVRSSPGQALLNWNSHQEMGGPGICLQGLSLVNFNSIAPQALCRI